MIPLILAHLHSRIAHARYVRRADRDRGIVTTEYVVMLALIVALVVAALAVLASKLMSRVNGIDLGGGG